MVVPQPTESARINQPLQPTNDAPPSKIDENKAAPTKAETRFVPSECAESNARLVLAAGLCSEREAVDFASLAQFVRNADQHELSDKFFAQARSTDADDDQQVHAIQNYINNENRFLICTPTIASLFHQLLKISVSCHRDNIQELACSDQTPIIKNIQQIYQDHFDESFSLISHLGTVMIEKNEAALKELSTRDDCDNLKTLISYVYSYFLRNMADVHRYRIQVSPSQSNLEADIATCLKFYERAIDVSRELFPAHSNDAYMSAQLNRTVFLHDVVPGAKDQAFKISSEVQEKCLEQINQLNNTLDTNILNQILCLSNLLGSNRSKWESMQRGDNGEGDTSD